MLSQSKSSGEDLRIGLNFHFAVQAKVRPGNVVREAE